ncbi:MarR family transcriptional regulator [Microbacterium sp. STN6]|uniref:MarR family winged helix-turn-helix transcriptional regulator n=1 Tax=Microbacterium sp. STN6 TaxID=2995588 RepID=UPI0022610316|nr:MarR family transcriptional regulator [Microbacterium sp. STN6]MCX7522066.1 MarR family transcriptional regulator [Microbacterium sp. STN6]
MYEVRQVFDDLIRFETMLWNTVDDRLQNEVGISLGNMNLLLVFEGTTNCRVQDIAQALAITVGGTSQAVDRLEKAGWCVRAAHPTDRRSSIVTLTDEGVAVLKRAKPVFDRELERLLVAPLTAPALGAFTESLGILRRSADRRRGDAEKKSPEKT